MEDCIFCKIVNKEIKSELVYEDEKFLSFKDINPKAPLHLIVIPKKHIASFNDFDLKDKELIGELFLAVQKIVKEQKVDQAGYRLVINTGKNSGQTINHIHIHLLAKKELLWD